MMRSGNPALRENIFTAQGSYDTANAMTIQGTVNKTFILLGLCVFTASLAWGNPAVFVPYIIPALILGLVLGFVTIFKKESAYITAPMYALAEGFVLGGISAIYEMRFPGIVMQAVALTFGTLFCLLTAYKSGLIKATENFKLGIAAATGAIFLIYMASLIMGFFGARIPFIHESGPIGIGFSLVVVAIAALNLVVDFDFIEKGAEYGAPRYMEWYGAFGLIVTLIWLYLEILRLLSKTRSR